MRKRNMTKGVALLTAVLMLVALLPVGMLSASSAVTANSGWDTSASTLYIRNASDLWAFAAKLNSGTTFSGKTVYLTADITVNEGWDASSSTVPTDCYPLTATGKTFAGTFDGQGHTVSGLYLSAGGHQVGFFGNVATGTTATVKNLTLVNSRIQNTNGACTGGIFGSVEAESSAIITDDSHVNATKAVIDNVHLNVVITAGGAYGGSTSGVAGFVGRNCADVQITDSSVSGSVTTASRGVAAFVGATYPTQVKVKVGENNVDVNAYATHTTIENCSNTMTLDVSAETALRFAGALVGYANSNTDCFTVRNVLSFGKMVGENIIGKKVDGTTINKPVGYLFGGTWCSANSLRNGSTTDYQTWTLDNVFYETFSENSLETFAKTSGGMQTNGFARGVAEAELSSFFKSRTEQSLTLKNDLRLNIFVPLVDCNATVTINGAAVFPVSHDGIEYRYELDGILPQQLRDSITVSVTQKLDDTRTVTTEYTTAVYSYLVQLWNTENATREERNLIADLLRYGAQAQQTKNYQTDLLATDGIDLSGYGNAVNASDIPTRYALTGTENADYAFEKNSLRLDTGVELLVSFRAASTDGLTVRATVNGRTTDFTEFREDASVGKFITFSDLNAFEMNAAVTFTMLKNGTQIGQSMTVSVADYVKQILTSSSAEYADWKPLVSALYAYGLSAQDYDDSNRLVLSSDYRIVYSLTAQDGSEEAAKVFADKLKRKTGLSLEVIDDSHASQDKEILIGWDVGGLGRIERITAERENVINPSGYRIVCSDEKIIVLVQEPDMMEYALDRLLDKIGMHGGSTWSIPNDYTETVDLPEFERIFAALQPTMYYAGSYNHTFSVNAESSSAETLGNAYRTFTANLQSAGFEAYATNTIGDNLFGTYIKSTDGYRTAVYTMYYPSLGNVRVTFGPIDCLPNTDPVAATTDDLTSSIILNARATTYCTAPGMSLVLQLADGSFIIIDGGNPDQSVATQSKADEIWTENDAEMTADAKQLYDLLVSMTPEGQKPTVAAWMITHAHGDHISLANQFLKTYHAFVDVKMAAYNFPDFATVTIANENPVYMEVLADAFVEEMRTYYPNAAHWVFHTGERLCLPGCEIEIFHTPEDYYGTSSASGSYAQNATFPWGNQTSCAFRITLGDTSLMVLGDCEADICLSMANRYKEALESDILQTTHHGYNGANFKFYEYVDPKICLWPTSQCKFETDERCLGSSAASSTATSSYLYANWWLRNTEWTRADGTHGTRTHYAVQADADSRILCPYTGKTVIVLPELKFN